MKLTTYTATGAKSSMTAPTSLFAESVNQQLLAQAIRVYQSNLRQGGGQTQRRSDVSVTKSKWYRQKGTGNARHGSKNAPIFVGGGVAHGPTGKENWRKALSQTQKRQALKAALTAQVENIVVSNEFEKLTGKTREAVALIKHMGGAEKRVLVVAAQPDSKSVRALRNLPNVLLTKASRLNALEVAMANLVILTKDAVDILEARLAKKAAPKTVETTTAKAAAAPTKKEAKPAEPKKTEPKAAKKAVKKAAPKKAAAKPKTAAKKPAKKPTSKKATS